MLDRQSGIVNLIITSLGGEAVNFMGKSSAYRTIYVVSEIWQHTGWNTIIYLSALSTVDAETLEAARIDGANRLQKILYIDVPAILPTIVILLIMRSGTVLNRVRKGLSASERSEPGCKRSHLHLHLQAWYFGRPIQLYNRYRIV